MTKKGIAISIFLVALSFNCLSQKYLTSKWQKKEYMHSSAIPRLDFWYSSKEKIMYLVTNDTENLYIHLKTLDKSSTRKILDLGCTVWIDANGKNKKRQSITFPMAKKERRPAIQFENEIETTNDRARGNRPALDMEYEIELNDFNGKGSNSIISANNETHINGKLNINENDELEYLLKVPFNTVGINLAENNIISINMETGSMEMEHTLGERPSGGTGISGGGPRGSSGGKPGGGQGMGGGKSRMSGDNGNMQQNRQEMSTPIKLKIKKIELLQKTP